MKRTLKKGLTMVLGLLMVMFMAVSVAFMQSKPTSAEPAEATFAMMDGADIRLDAENYGIRFKATVADEAQEYKMIIVPYSWIEAIMAEEGESFDYNTTDYVAKFSGRQIAEMTCSVNDGGYIQGSLVDIKYSNINKDWFGVAYYNDGTQNVYATIDADNACYKVGTVASSVLNSGEVDGTDADIVLNLVYSSANATDGELEGNKFNPVDFGVASDETAVELGAEAVNYNANIKAVAEKYGFVVSATSSDSTVATVADDFTATAGQYFGYATVNAKFLGKNYTYKVKSPINATIKNNAVILNAKPDSTLSAYADGNSAGTVSGTFDVDDVILAGITVADGEQTVSVKVQDANGLEWSKDYAVFGLTQSNFVAEMKTSANIVTSGRVYVLKESVVLNVTNFATDVKADGSEAAGRSYAFAQIFKATLNAQGNSITLDMGSSADWPYNIKDVLNAGKSSFGGLFNTVNSATIKNLSYYYFEDAPEKVDSRGTSTSDMNFKRSSFFANGVSGGFKRASDIPARIENCYFNVYSTELASGEVQHVFGSTSRGVKVENCVFDLRTGSADGKSVLRTSDVTKYIDDHSAVGKPEFIDCVIIKDTESTAPWSSGWAVNTTTISTGVVNYATFADAFSANAWADNATYSVSENKLAFYNEAVKEHFMPSAISCADGKITVTDGEVGVNYDVMQYNGAEWVKASVATANSNFSINNVELAVGSNTYQVKLALDSAETNSVEFTVFGLDNTNFLSVLQPRTFSSETVNSGNVLATQPAAADRIYYVLTENIVLDSNAFTTGALNWRKHFVLGRFWDTLDGLGNSITLDMGKYEDWATQRQNVGLFVYLSGTIRNLSYYFLSDAAARYTNANDLLEDGYFAATMGSDNAPTPLLENCYVAGLYTAYTTVHDSVPIPHISRKAQLENCIFDTQVRQADGTVTYLDRFINKVSKNGPNIATMSNVIVIGLDGEEIHDILGANGKDDTGEDMIVAQGYESYSSVISADNWLDSSSAWTITDGVIYLSGKKLFADNNKINLAASYSDGYISVDSATYLADYNVMQLVGETWTQVGTAKVGDKISIAEFELKAGLNTYSIKLVGDNRESNVVNFEVFGLDNTNFLSELKANTIISGAGVNNGGTYPTAATNTYFVLIEDIVLDVTAFDNGAVYYNMYSIFGTFWDTLDGLGNSITLDMGKSTEWANNRMYRGLFNQLNGNVRNLSYYYLEDAANKTLASGQKLNAGYFAGNAGLQNATVYPHIENCYFTALYTAYTAGNVSSPFAHLYRNVKVENCVFDTQVKQADGTISYLTSIANRVSRNTANHQPKANNNIIIGATGDVIVNILGSDAATATSDNLTVAQGYESYASAISADNWLDSSSVWSIVDDELYHFDNKIATDYLAIGYDLTEGTISVENSIAGAEYDLMQKVDGQWTKIATIKPGDVLDHSVLTIAPGKQVIEIRLEKEGYVGKITSLNVYGLNNENFITGLKSYTQNGDYRQDFTVELYYDDMLEGNFVLLEDIILSQGAYLYTDGVDRATEQEHNDAVEQGLFKPVRNGNVISMFATFRDHLDGLGHSITIDVGSSSDWGYILSDWTDTYALGGLFTSVKGYIKNLNYNYIEDAPDMVDYGTTNHGFLTTDILQNGTENGQTEKTGLKNVYVNAIVTAYDSGATVCAMTSLSYRANIEDCLFNIKVVSADGATTTQSSTIMLKRVYHAAAVVGKPQLTNVMVIADSASIAPNYENSVLRDESINISTNNYATLSAAVAADNWLDTSSAFTIADGELYFFDTKISFKEAIPGELSYSDTVLTVTGGAEGIEYDVMQSTDGGTSWSKATTAMLGDELSIAKLNLIEGNQTYQVKLAYGDLEGNVVDFTVYGLGNDNFVPVLKDVTLGDIKTGDNIKTYASVASGNYFVLIEDVTIGAGAYFFTDGVIEGTTGADFASANAKYAKIVNNYNITAFGALYDTLDGLGHTLTFDVGSQSIKTDKFNASTTATTAPGTDEFIRLMIASGSWNFAGLFTSVRAGGVIKNLSYLYKEDFADRKTGTSSPQPALFTRQVYGTIENCYIKAEVTAYNTAGKTVNAIYEPTSGGKILNTIFDLQSITASSEITRVNDIYPGNAGKKSTATHTNNIIIGGADLVSVGENLTSVDAGKAIAYADYATAISADNWLDTSSVFTIVEGELYFFGNKIS